MADGTEKSSLAQIAEILLSHGVEFIVVGGQAETIFGSARVTLDIDLCYRRTRDNLQRLAAALHEIKPTLRNAPIDEQTLALGNNLLSTARSATWTFWAIWNHWGTMKQSLNAQSPSQYRISRVRSNQKAIRTGPFGNCAYPTFWTLCFVE